MKLVKAWPPNIADIRAVFPDLPPGVFFSWGDTIYNPDAVVLTPSLLRHESIHLARQNGNPQEWWDRYLASAEFRLAEEIPAHHAEFWLEARGVSHHHRDAILDAIAERLSGNLYGCLIQPAQARARIKIGH